MKNTDERLHTHTLCLHSLCLLPPSQRFLLPVSPCPAPASELAAASDPPSTLSPSRPFPRPPPQHPHSARPLSAQARSQLGLPSLWTPRLPRTAVPGSPRAPNPAGSLASSLTHIHGPPNLSSWRRLRVPRHRPGLTPAPAPPHSTPALAASRCPAASSEPGAAPRLSGSSPSLRPRSPAAAATAPRRPRCCCGRRERHSHASSPPLSASPSEKDSAPSA